MAKSPVPTLGDLWRTKDSSIIMQRPRSPKVEKKFNFPTSSNKEDWQTVTSAVTALFQRKKLANLELDSLTEKVRLVKADIGNSELCKRFREEILVKGMIILRDIKVNSGVQLLEKLASTWTHFFHTVLPLVQAIFVNLQPADGYSVRDVSLITFRDIVVLKTKLEEAFQMGLPAPPHVVQMLLILQVIVLAKAKLSLLFYHLFSKATSKLYIKAFFQRYMYLCSPSSEICSRLHQIILPSLFYLITECP